MKKSTESAKKPLRGIAALFDDFERKQLFHKYLFFLGWLEIAIFAICWLYQLGDRGHDRFGPIEIPFPWKAYFLISFLTPVAITFLLGVVIVGFNKYFSESDSVGETEKDSHGHKGDGAGRIHKLNKLVNWLQQLPYLGLLLLLGVSMGVVYKLDAILDFITSVGSKSVQILLISVAVLTALAAVLGVILIVLNFQLRKRSMAYEYKKEVAERFGLIILEDNSVLDSNGRLLVQGKKWKDTVPLLPAETAQSDQKQKTGNPIPRPVDIEVS
jgi:hypothetical protein